MKALFFCGEEYILFEISLVAVATTKKVFKNRLIVYVCCLCLETLHLIQYDILGAFKTLRKATFIFLMSLCTYVSSFF